MWRKRIAAAALALMLPWAAAAENADIPADTPPAVQAEEPASVPAVDPEPAADEPAMPQEQQADQPQDQEQQPETAFSGEQETADQPDAPADEVQTPDAGLPAEGGASPEDAPAVPEADTVPAELPSDGTDTPSEQPAAAPENEDVTGSAAEDQPGEQDGTPAEPDKEPETTAPPEETEPQEPAETQDTSEITEETGETGETGDTEETAEPEEQSEEAAATASDLDESAEEPDAWDEEACDHANLMCELAPACEKEGCGHIGTDVHGLPVPLCEKGKWVLDRQDELLRQGGAGVRTRSVRKNTIDLNQGSVTIWRSGKYSLKGGEEQAAATVTIAENRVVILSLDQAAVSEWTLSAGVQAEIRFTGINTVGMLKVMDGVDLTLAGGDEIHFEGWEGDLNARNLHIQGGTVTGLPEDEPQPPEPAPAITVFDLSETPDVTVEGLSEITVIGASGPVAGSVAISGSCDAAMKNVQLQGGGPLLTVHSGSVTAAFSGSCALDGAAPVRIDSGASLKLTAVTGRLDLSDTPAGAELYGNIRTPDAAAQADLALRLEDESGEPVCSAAVTLVTGGTVYHVTTFDDGCVYLWGIGKQQEADAAASDGSQVYTAVILNGQGTAVPGLDITGIQAEDQPDGTLRISWTADGAMSAGVLYSAAGEPVPDTWNDALSMETGNGQAVLSGLKPGATVCFRVFVTSQEGARLNADTADGFQFSEAVTHVHRAPFQTEEDLDAEYTGKAYKNPLTLPEGASVEYDGEHLNREGLPVRVGKYTMRITIPEGDPVWLPGVTELTFRIRKAVLEIIPEENQFKFEGEPDPDEYPYTVSGLLPGDEVTGRLTREEGEEAGNYAFLTDELKAAEYYQIRLAKDAADFEILPEFSFYFPPYVDPAVPVHQRITRADGRKVSVVLSTKNTLKIGSHDLGTLVYSTEDGKPRLFLPSLSYNEKTDEVLLRIFAAAELNKDQGWQTDSTGAPLWKGREMRLSWAVMNSMRRLGVDAVAFCCGSSALLVRLDELLSNDNQQEMLKREVRPGIARFTLRLEPAEQRESDLLDSAGAVTKAWQAGIHMQAAGKSWSWAGKTAEVLLMMDVEATADTLTRMDRYDPDTFPELLTMLLAADGQAAPMQNVPMMIPFSGEEYSSVGYPGALYTHRYLLAHLTRNGTAAIARKPAKELEAKANE